MSFSDRRSLGLIHLTALALVVGFSIHAMRARPATKLVGQAKVNAAATLTARNAQAHGAWDMDLRLDQTIKPPGWSWIMYEGKAPGAGYELHWLADEKVIQIRRAQPEAFLLASAHLTRQPTRVTFQRRGGALAALVDNQPILHCLDPDGPLDLGATDWGCSSSGGTLGDATLTVQEVDSPTIAESRPNPFRTIAAACAATRDREALAVALDNPAQSSVAALFGLANQCLGAERNILDREQPGRALSPNDRTTLRMWLALAHIRLELARQDASFDDTYTRVKTDIETLLTASSQTQLAHDQRQIPELAGILMSLTGTLAQRAGAISLTTTDVSPTPTAIAQWNQQILEERSRWLELLAEVTARALAIAQDSLAPNDLAQIQLLLHATGCLWSAGDPSPELDLSLPAGEHHRESRLSPLPVPLDGPSWLTSRWRAFVGVAPGVEHFAPIAGTSGPVTQALELFADYMDLNPVPALSLRYQIMDLMAQRELLLRLGKERETERKLLEDKILSACQDPRVPLRERYISRKIVMLYLASTRSDLLPQMREDHETDLTRTDPLAFAIDQLIAVRFPETTATDGPALDATKESINRFFPESQVLMDGSPASLARIWRFRMPHAQALAVALIMNEVKGGDPDWSLLHRIPGFTLPLLLLQRVDAPAATSGGSGISQDPGLPP